MHSDEPKVIRIDVKGEKEVTAADIIHDADIEILNPDLHIATVNEAGSLKIDMVVEHGLGYVPAEKKKTQETYDIKIAELTEVLTVAKEANWLYEKFGDGEYKDILGLCKVAYTTDKAKGNDKDGVSIEEKGWTLTPGAYVGVAPVEDDGVDFEERMAEIHRELLSLQAESNDLMDTISHNMKEMGL